MYYSDPAPRERKSRRAEWIRQQGRPRSSGVRRMMEPEMVGAGSRRRRPQGYQWRHGDLGEGASVPGGSHRRGTTGGCAAQPGSHRAGSAKRAEVAARRHRRASEGSTGRLPTTPRAPLHAPSTSAATARKETDPDLIRIPTPRTRGDAQPAMALQVTDALFVGRQAACSNGVVVLIQWCSLQ